MGSILCGFVTVYIDTQIVLSLSMFIMTISIFFVPICTSLYQLYAVMILNGMFSGFIENASTCFVINAFGKENAGFLQTSKNKI